MKNQRTASLDLCIKRPGRIFTHHTGSFYYDAYTLNIQDEGLPIGPVVFVRFKLYCLD